MVNGVIVTEEGKNERFGSGTVTLTFAISLPISFRFTN